MSGKIGLQGGGESPTQRFKDKKTKSSRDLYGRGLVNLQFPREHSLAIRAWLAATSKEAAYEQEMSVNGEVSSVKRLYLWLGPLLD